MSDIKVKELARDLQRSIENLQVGGELGTSGIVTRVGDGVAWIYGLTDCGFNEIVRIETADGVVEAFALNLMEDEIGAVLLGEDSKVKAGARVTLAGNVLSVPVGEELLGRVVDPLGRPLDGKGPIKTK